ARDRASVAPAARAHRARQRTTGETIGMDVKRRLLRCAGNGYYREDTHLSATCTEKQVPLSRPVNGRAAVQTLNRVSDVRVCGPICYRSIKVSQPFDQIADSFAEGNQNAACAA
ncbi:MAG: hypothetical protein ACLGI6_15705, partial [Gammaproteobacteria bacterium]